MEIVAFILLGSVLVRYICMYRRLLHLHGWAELGGVTQKWVEVRLMTFEMEHTHLMTALFSPDVIAWTVCVPKGLSSS